jgi:hypothetical protein
VEAQLSPAALATQDLPVLMEGHARRALRIRIRTRSEAQVVLYVPLEPCHQWEAPQLLSVSVILLNLGMLVAACMGPDTFKTKMKNVHLSKTLLPIHTEFVGFQQDIKLMVFQRGVLQDLHSTDIVKDKNS